MMRTKLRSLLIIAFLQLPRDAELAPASAAAAGGSTGRVLKTRNTGRSCRCVPNQWEGRLNTLEREFSLLGGQAMERESSMAVYYDYVNRLFASVDVDTGSKSIADYKKGLKYVIGEEGCRVISSKETMPRMCLPEYARLIDEFKMGLDIPVTSWIFTSEENSTIRTQVSRSSCMPVSEETYVVETDFAFLTTSYYVNVTLGIKNPKVFSPPKGCRRKSSNKQIPLSDETSQQLEELIK